MQLQKYKKLVIHPNRERTYVRDEVRTYIIWINIFYDTYRTHIVFNKSKKIRPTRFFTTSTYM